MRHLVITAFIFILLISCQSLPGNAQETESRSPESTPRSENLPTPVQREASSYIEARNIEEVVVSEEKPTPSTEMRPDTELLLNVAGAGLDPLSAVLSLPGVTFASDYSSEPAVRGSAPDDNGYYIDLIPARYIFHIFGHSIFNHNLIHSFDLYPAAFSSQFSNASGAIIDVRLRDPRNQEFTTTLDASFLSTGALLESRITDTQAFYFSYRRSLIDLFIRDEEDIDDEDAGIEVDQIPISDDYQLKYVWNISDAHRFSVIGAGASDEVAATFLQNSNAALIDPDLTGPASVETSFHSQGVIWDWQPTDNAQQLKVLATHTTDTDDIVYGTGQFINVETERGMLKAHWQLNLGDRHRLLLGSSIEETDYDLIVNAKLPSCSDFDPFCPTIDAPLFTFREQFSLTSHVAYVEDEWKPGDFLSIRTGLHFLSDDYLDKSKTEPRIRVGFSFTDNIGMHLAYGKYSQLPQPDEIAPQIGNPNLDYIEAAHGVIGFQQQFGDQWSWQVELYHKQLENLPLSLSPLTDADFQQRYSNDANGRAYGIEFLVNKNLTRKLYGWLAISLSHTERENERTGGIREFDFDKPVIINLVANYKLTEGWMLGLKWSLQSGGLYTPIVDTRPNTGNPTVQEPVYGELNSERLPFYHRLDLRVEYTQPTRFGMWSFFVDVLNAYNARNIQGYSYAPNNNDTISNTPDGFGDNVPVSRSEGLGWFPSIGFKIQF